MNDFGLFDIIGPCMIGPSSSHTAGAARLGYVAYRLAHGRPLSARVTLYGSFAQTGRGHGTDKAIIGGILGFSPSDPRLKNSIQEAKNGGYDYTVDFSDEEAAHPNTARIIVHPEDGKTYDILGVSVGGGNIEIRKINGMDVSFSADYPTLLVFYKDRPGVISAVTSILSDACINVAFMKVFRTSKRQDACMVLETDEKIPEGLTDKIKGLSPDIDGVCVL